MPKVGNVHILYALDIVAYENKPGPNSLITGKITGNFLKFSSSCDIKIFPIYRLVPHLDACIRHSIENNTTIIVVFCRQDIISCRRGVAASYGLNLSQTLRTPPTEVGLAGLRQS